jgi:hypothetical protein
MLRALRVRLDTKVPRDLAKHVFVRARQLVDYSRRLLGYQGELQRRELQGRSWLYYRLLDGMCLLHCLLSRTLIQFGLQDFLTGRDIPMMNENAISNILIDVDFLEDELKRIGRSHLVTVFIELRLVSQRFTACIATSHLLCVCLGKIF